MNTLDAHWRPVRSLSRSMFPDTDRVWDCNPAWDITGIYRQADMLVPMPVPADEEEAAKRVGVFVDRHLDRRFHIEYGLASRDRPRASTPVINDQAREWEIVIEHRDRYLADAGLTLDSPPAQIARCLAESFLWRNYFKDKPMCDFYSENQRALSHPVDGLLFKSHCVACATGFTAMAQSCGFPPRNMGVGAHWVAEVLVDGHWRYVENTGRHEKNEGLGAYFENTHMWLSTHSGEEISTPITPGIRRGFWRRINPQYHNFILGTWQDPATLRTAAHCLYALYPQEDQWFIKEEDEHRLPIMRQAGGYYSPGMHGSYVKTLAPERKPEPCELPEAIHRRTTGRAYLYHPLQPGEKLRVSFALDREPGELDQVEIVIPFGVSHMSDFSDDAGKRLILNIGSKSRSLSELGSWPPVDPANGEPARATVKLAADDFSFGSINWLILENATASVYQMPYVPNAMEPYIAPLFSQT